MQIPPELISKIELLINGSSLSEISSARKELTSLYRRKDCNNYFKPLGSDHQRLAYLIARFPATYAVVCQVLMEMRSRCSRDPVDSLLDIGAGPGTALLAAREASIPLSQATMVERDSGFIKLGKELAGDSSEQNWICQDVIKELNLEPHDLVIASYSLGELSENDRMKVLGNIWRLTSKILIVIEPGTKAAFESLRKIRDYLLIHGGHLVSPCPHSEKCPMKKMDWCHFSARIERTSLHRKIKDAILNYEDEKFSYLIFSKNKVEPCQTRILRHPFKGSGFIKLQLCSKNGIEEKTITKKHKSQFSYARKAEWGDEFPLV
jgi:ribosomal protein RSM22 (predicted rRNA methylase)